MEGSGAITQAVRRDPATVRVTRAGILVASLGALLVIFNPFGAALAGLVLAAGGALIAARGGIGHGWFSLLAAGAIMVVLSRLFAQSAETLGGWLAVLGVVCILVAASLGFPLAGDLEE